MVTGQKARGIHGLEEPELLEREVDRVFGDAALESGSGEEYLNPQELEKQHRQRREPNTLFTSKTAKGCFPWQTAVLLSDLA